MRKLRRMPAMRYRTFERRADQTGPDVRQAVMRATERLLEDHSLDELRVTDVIREAEVSRATFYLYFESKYAVVAALVEAVVEEVFEDVWRPWLAGAEPDDPEILVDHMRRTIGLWRDHRAVIVATAQGWRTHTPVFGAWGDIMRRYINDVRIYIERARASGSAPPGLDAEMLAAVLVWGNESAFYLSFTDAAPEFEDQERLATTVAGLWWRAIYAEEPVPGEMS